MKKILLNYLPPADVYTPSAALSILKSFMQKEGFITQIKYWNFLFNPILPFGESEETSKVILPFISIINDWKNNDLGNARAIELLKETSKEEVKQKPDYYQNVIDISKNAIQSIIEAELQKLVFGDILLFGFTSKFHQWIPAILVSKAIKAISPQSKIIIGGFGSKQAAMEAMKMNPNLDFATWGEGEYPLLELAKQLRYQTFDYNQVPRLAFREKDEIRISTTNRSNYLDFQNYPFPDLSDYFNTYPEPKGKYKIVIPINSSRACSWNKCKFCDYNSGYKFRVRSPESIIGEIEYFAKTYRSACFSFVDNDIFINALHFENLLDLMIASKNKYNYDYEFWAEMIPNESLTEVLIHKMQNAGFTQVFIGYDGISDSLLSKMQKSNTFSVNLFFVKFAQKYEIDPLVNIIIGLPDESLDDIQEGVNNLHFLRFFYNQEENFLYHDYVPLVISRMSTYYSMISEEEKEDYSMNDICKILPKQFSNHRDRFNLFSFKKPILQHQKDWEELKEKEKYYTENTFIYKIEKSNGVLNYKEFLNGKEIVNHDFKEAYYEEILRHSNSKVMQLEELENDLRKTHPKLKTGQLKELLNDLKSMHLIYCNNECSNIISVIDFPISLV